MKTRHPESLMMSHGFYPEWSEGSIKPPLFQTSTFVFRSAEEGKAYFELAYGLREAELDEKMGLIYSRINNPNLEILEERLCLWDKAPSAVVFESGMSAISTVLLEFLKPGDALLYSRPTYGGTDHFIHDYLDRIGVESIGFSAGETEEEIMQRVEAAGVRDKVAFIYVETPANPTNSLIDIEMCSRLKDGLSSADKKVFLGVDNTYMGPLWSHPMDHGADLVLYSATKYLGGHSDLIAGAVVGHVEVMQRVRNLRTFLGNMPSPHTCWLLLRSLETLKVRMDQQCRNAQKLADHLRQHPAISKVHYLGLLEEGTPEYALYKKQYSAPGAMISIELHGGESEAFQFLNGLKLFKLAVSLGSTESLAQHPATMTHAGMSLEEKQALGITSCLVRLSIGIEHADDLIDDLDRALSTIGQPELVV
jgi:methionine-gamma-lyase